MVEGRPDVICGESHGNSKRHSLYEFQPLAVSLYFLGYLQFFVANAEYP